MLQTSKDRQMGRTGDKSSETPDKIENTPLTRTVL